MTSPSHDVSARISRLFVYPVKSCAGVELQESVLTETGLDLDRAWMVMDEQGEFVSQRELPRMALIQPRLRFHDMILRAPGMLALHVSIEEVEQPVKVRVWGEEVSAFDMGPIAAQWMSDFLGRKLRLVRFDPDHRRVSSLRWTGGVEALNQFSDGYALLVLSLASVDELNTRLAAAGHAAVGVERFRPNLVLDGVESHDEDRLPELSIALGDGRHAQLQLVKPCARCPIPNIDPVSGVSSPHVGDMLQTYRQDARLDGACTFGMNAIVRSGVDGVLRTGQTVQGNYRF